MEKIGRPEKEIYGFLEQAAGYTVDFTGKEDILLSKREIDIMLLLLQINVQEEKLLQIQRCIKKYYSSDLREQVYPRIQLELSKLYEKQGRHMQAVQEAERGLKSIWRGKSYRYAAELYFICARNLWQEAFQKEVRRKEVCTEMCLKAYYLYKLEKNERVKEIEKYLREELRWRYII